MTMQPSQPTTAPRSHSGKGLHGLGPPPKPGGSGKFGAALLVIASVPFALGAWGCIQGFVTLTWPRADAVVYYADFRLNPASNSNDRPGASMDVRYSYRVDGKSHSGRGLEPYAYGLQNTARAREQSGRNANGMRVSVAYDPKDPGVSYLEPGPSTTSMMFLGVGTIVWLLGALIFRLGQVQKRASERIAGGRS